MRTPSMSVTIFILLLILGCAAWAKDDPGALSPQLVDKLRAQCRDQGDQKVMINAVTNNNIKDLALNREKVVTHDKFMSLKLKTSKVINQKSSGRCWMFAGVNVLSPQIMAKLKTDNFEISEPYLAFWDKMEKANFFLEEVIRLRDKPFDDRELEVVVKSPFGDGGWWHYFADLIDKYGLMPISAMPETKQSSATGRVNGLATTLLRSAAADIRAMHREGTDVKQLRQMKEETLADIYRLMVYSYGQPPDSFYFRYESNDTALKPQPRWYTPKEFYGEVAGDDMREYVALINNPARDMDQLFKLESSRNIADKPDLTVLNLTSAELKEYALASLVDSQAVWFACDVGKENYSDSGVMAVDIYDYNATFQMDFKMSKADRITYKQITPNHAMTLVGVDTTDSGAPGKWLVENSWGTKRGDSGLWYMYDDWFDEYVLMVIIDKSLLSDEDAHKLEQKPIAIPQWEPFFLALRSLN